MNNEPNEQSKQDTGKRISDAASLLRSINIQSPDSSANRDGMIDANGRRINYSDK